MKLNTFIGKWMKGWISNNAKFIDVMDQGKSMKSSNSEIRRTESAISLQLVSLNDGVRVSGNQSEWCLYRGEETPSAVIVGTTDIDDVQSVIELLGI